MSAAGVAVFASVLSGTGAKSRDYVVAARSLPAGSMIDSSELSVIALALPPSVAGQAFTIATSVVGRTLAGPVHAGQLIESSMLDARTPTRRPVSIAVNPDSLLGLLPGELVDVLSASPVVSSVTAQPAGTGASTSQPAGSSQATASPQALPATVIMRGALLISVGHASSGLAGTSGGLIDVTLGVSDLSEVELLVASSQRSNVELVLAEPSDGVGPGAGG